MGWSEVEYAGSAKAPAVRHQVIAVFNHCKPLWCGHRERLDRMFKG
jgi:hypothetical protein